ncbi:MAG: DUF5686 family protein [Flavobacteriaceae bacterium]|nr:DUF5686 family protein [Flavobacteriaceae bacterium]
MKRLLIIIGLMLANVLLNAQNEREIQTLTISKKKKKYKNPAHEILAKLVAKKHINNPDNLQSYSAEKHTRIEIAMNSLGDKFQNKQIYKDLKNIMENAKDSVSGAILPIFISENISDYYQQKSPKNIAEVIKKSKVQGVGIQDDTLFSQLMSSTFIQYNFYNNYIRVLDKDFISPINDNFTLQYDYELVNRDFQENDRGYYQINFKPKRASDLAFEGTLLIDHATYSLYKIKAKISPSANLNFINNVVIEQELAELEDSEIHMPIKSRISVETAKLGKNGMSGLLKFYTSSKGIRINQELEPKIFDKAITILPNAHQEGEEYWENHRHDPLTTTEKKMFAMIDEVKNLPSIKSYLDIIDMLINGYYNAGKIDIGPVLYSGGYSDVEGVRLRLGFRTSHKFSNQWILGGYLGYGFKDKQVKFGANVDYILSREPWTQVGASVSHDLDQVALQFGNSFIKQFGLFDAFAKNGKTSLRQPFWKNNYQVYFQTDWLKSFTNKIIFKHTTFNPLFDFSFVKDNGEEIHTFKTSEVILETEWKPGRRNIQSVRNKQIKLAENIYFPTITFRYTHGFKGVLGSDFEYNKFHLNIRQRIPMGLFGRGEASLTGGIIPNKVPYPLLENHLGNELIFYNRLAFNMMRFFEFTSNRYASLQYTQYLEGLITNSLPIIKKWNWRNHITFNYLIGDLDKSFNSNGMLNSLHGKAYMELGYGVSNIFRFLRVDFTHRLTHLKSQPRSNEAPPKFSVKISAQIRL